MATYLVHLRPATSQGTRDMANADFVRDGFSLTAFVFGPLWLLANRLWLATLLWLVVAAGLVGLAIWRGIDEGAIALMGALLHLLIGLEGRNLRNRKLDRRGRPTIDVVDAGSQIEAERRFFRRAGASAAAAPSPAAPRHPGLAPMPLTGHDEIVGVFPGMGS